MSNRSTGHRLLDPGALLKIGRLGLESRQAMQGTVTGKHKSPHRGSSLEFAEYREYVPGDDLRRMDWRAYARSDRYYIKEFEADTNLRLCMVVDASGSMAYGDSSNVGNGESTLSKFEFASQLAALMGYVAIRQGDAAGLTLASEGEGLHLPPKRRPSHLGLVQDALIRAKPTGSNDLAATLHELAERTRQRAMVVVISDLFTDPGDLAGAFQHLRFRNHDTVVFHILEERELEFAFDRTTRFVDMEGGASLVAEPAVIASRYRRALSNYFEALGDGVRKADVDYQRALLHEDPADVLTQFLLKRMRRRGRR